MTDSLLREVMPGPIRPLNQTEARGVIIGLRDMAKSHKEIAELLASESPLKDFIIAALSLSPFLRDTAQVSPDLLVRAITLPIESRLAELVAHARNAWRPEKGALTNEHLLMARLRQAKREAAFLTALADLARLFDATRTTAWLSRVASAAVSAAIDHLLLLGDEGGKLKLHDKTEPSRGSGVIVLGMGKLGGEELNYSSDIDLVVFFDPLSGILVDPQDATDTFARLLRRMIRIMQDRTADGYVFRTDLRLRPDPGSTPLAIPVEAAILYYESRGQNWERAAFIKARPIAGDMEAGARFMTELVPFVFRKYLDYAAIADIHSIKRQIHAHKGFGDIAVKGHNIKLGRGGIREIEFFVQTQQLIAGGRVPGLRLRRTEDMLRALTDTHWIDPATRDELITAYWFLRDVEHRIQMVRDEQTHTLPDTEAELKRIAFMLGFESTAAFSEKLVTVLKTVERRYAKLFEQENRLSKGSGNLVFTGQNDDPDTLETLRKLGFKRPEDISRIIRTWHYGRYRATQSVEARERLTELMPELLTVFGQNRKADEAFLRFDQFISGLPAGIQLFSLLSTNPGLLTLIVTIMSAAPRLADIVAAKPHVFDGMLDPALLSELPNRDYLSERLDTFLGGSPHYEETLDRLRIFASEQRFLIGIRLLTGVIAGAQAGRAFSDLADLVINAALSAVLKEIETVHGRFAGARIAVVGMGKLGSREMTAGSDVDLILLYDYDDAAAESDGQKPIDSNRYFGRITQRLIAALSSPMTEGVLYEVDMRLRPSGNKGPVATRINSFEKYQREEAWTWEHMALTRARLISGDLELVAETRRIMDAVMAQVRDPKKIARDVAEMREMIDQEKPPKDIWDFKLIPGGLVDIEFIAQYLTLVAPAYSINPEKRMTDTAETLKAVGAGIMDPNDLETVLAALKLFADLSQIVRLSIDGPYEPKEAPEGLTDLMCRVSDMPDITTLEAEIRGFSLSVRDIFMKLISVN